MKLLDNKANRVIDALKGDIKAGSSIYIVSSDFTIFAYEHLKTELNKAKNICFLFSNTPTYIESSASKREFELKTSVSGNIYEILLKNALNQSYIAKECAEWVTNKVEVKTCSAGYPVPQKMYIVQNKNKENSVIVGSSDFTSNGLGVVASKQMELNTYSSEASFVEQCLDTFTTVWNNRTSVHDIKKEFLQSLEVVYKENSPETIYYNTLYHIFKSYAEDLSNEDVLKTKTGFKESIVWNTLYNFQQDGVLGCIDKLEKYNGCILADSVGLGKTFEALAVIKYYESRNDKVLVLCPKKLRENWLTYKGNRKDNTLLQDRLNYDVLNHTDLTRSSGISGDIDLDKVYWENYDLLVIDESHNFRNSSNKKDGKDTRYSRLLEEIIQKGVKTKILMLTATPVNQGMNDLKNQIAFITEGDSTHFSEHGIHNIDSTLRRAQGSFNKWFALTEEEKTIETLQNMLDTDYFKLLDMLTIARSRKHVLKYYDTESIGRFPTRLPPENITTKIDTNRDFMQVSELNKELRKLNLAIYSPIEYVLPHKKEAYSKKYDTNTGKSIFKQTDREKSLIHLMRINILKRMESSINSFAITLKKLIKNIEVE